MPSIKSKFNPIHHLIDVIKSTEFNAEICELSVYAANVKQERQIVSLLAKFLTREGYKTILEQVNPNAESKKTKYDLCLDGINIECKYHFDFDIQIMKTENRTIEQYRKELETKEKNLSWGIKPVIIKDIFYNKPDVFIWIVVTRDLSNISDGEIAAYCYGKEQRRYNKAPKEIEPVINKFLEEIYSEKTYTTETHTIQTKDKVNSKYDFYICNFIN